MVGRRKTLINQPINHSDILHVLYALRLITGFFLRFVNEKPIRVIIAKTEKSNIFLKYIILKRVTNKETH